MSGPVPSSDARSVALAAVIRRLALIVLGVLLACVVLEVVLRFSDVVPEVGSPLYSVNDSDPYLGWSGKPDVRLRYRRPEFDTLVQHDDAGWRQAEPPRPAHPARRILVLGDSFTWGWGVSQGEVFTDRLQAALPPTVAVYNRGVAGFGNAQEYLVLERELAASPYDTVLLMFFINDVSDNVDGEDGQRPYFELVDGRLVPRNQPAVLQTSAVQRFLKTRSRAYLFIACELGNLKRRFTGVADDDRRYRESGPVDFHDLPGYAVTARLLVEMQRTAHEHSARFFLVYIPQHSEFDLSVPYPYVRAVHEMIDDIAGRAGIPTVDLSAAFRERAEAGRVLVYPVDGHWTPEGHRLAAEVLLSSAVFQPPDTFRPPPHGSDTAQAADAEPLQAPGF